MAALNADLTWDSVDPSVRRAFRHQAAERVTLRIGHALYKYSGQHPINPANGRVTPWWSSVLPLSADDPGLAISQERAKRLGVTETQFTRARAAVTKQWNDLTDLYLARLQIEACGFYGECSHQRVDESDPKVVFIGGGYQVWIPNLEPPHVIVDRG